jgi:hypothetical protein
MFQTRSRWIARFLTASLLAVLACNKDPAPKPPLDAPKKVSEVTGDTPGFNEFLPPSGGAAPLAVRGDAGAGAPIPGVPAAAVAKMRLVEPGAEPRVVRKYTFVANKAERRTLTIRQSVQQEQQKQEQPGLAMTVDFVAKDVKPTGSKFEMKVIKVDLADKEKLPAQMQAQAAQELGTFAGLTALFDVSPRGEVGEVTMSGDKKMAKEGAAELLEAFQQFVELVLAPLPEEPIGVGAKWEVAEEQEDRGAGGPPVKVTGKRVLELKELADGGGTIVTTIEKKVPKRSAGEQRGISMTVQLDASGSYTYAFKFDRIAPKVVGEQTSIITRELTNPENPKQSKKIVQEAKVRHVLEAPAAGK